MSWFSEWLKKGFKIKINLCWPGEKGMKEPDNFNNPGTRQKPIDEIINIHKKEEVKK
jgi:hypothetical protein